MSTKIPLQAMHRLPQYLQYLKSLPKEGYISATAIAEACGLNDVVVRKDLAAVSRGGKPKLGYVTETLTRDLEQFLGYTDVNDAVLVGAGNLGRALLSYSGFQNYGLNIVAGFDTDPRLIGTEIHRKKIFPLSEMKHICARIQIHIGIITVPASQAQSVCNQLIDCGITALWNFAPVYLKVPDHILLQNENMATSLALLSRRLSEKIQE